MRPAASKRIVVGVTPGTAKPTLRPRASRLSTNERPAGVVVVTVRVDALYTFCHVRRGHAAPSAQSGVFVSVVVVSVATLKGFRGSVSVTDRAVFVNRTSPSGVVTVVSVCGRSIPHRPSSSVFDRVTVPSAAVVALLPSLRLRTTRDVAPLGPTTIVSSSPVGSSCTV